MKERDALISENLGLVHACANRFRGKGIEYDDLYSAGCVGLVKAADGFCPDKGFAFSTYAVPAILGEIRRLFRDGGAVKVSRAVKERAREAVHLRDKMTAELDREVTVRELSLALGIDEFETAELLNSTLPPMSLTATDETGERQLDIPVDAPDEEIADRVALREILSALPTEDRRLIELRYFKGFTQVNTAKFLGISQVQVSRRERAILLDMRRRMTG